MSAMRLLCLHAVLLSAAAIAAPAPSFPGPGNRIWVPVPDTRVDVSTDLTSITAEDLMDRASLFRETVVSLSEEQVSALGSGEGLPFARLSPQSGFLLQRAMRPPLEVTTERLVDFGSGGRADPRAVRKASVPLGDVPWDQVRLRARLLAANLDLKTRDGVDTGLTLERPMAGQTLTDPRPLIWPRPSFLPVQITVPNTPKPSDLPPQGLSLPFSRPRRKEIFTVRETLDRVAGITGLNLRADPRLPDMLFSIDIPDATCGEVLVNLALKLGGAYRKVGDTYLLAWDRRGLGSVQQALHERSEPLRAKVQNRDRQAEWSMTWVSMARLLPFHPAGLELTESQRERLFGASSDQVPSPGLRVTDLEPWQRKYVESVTRGQIVPRPNAGESDPGRPVTVEEVRGATLRSGMAVRLEIYLPEYGWVSTKEVSSLYVHSGMLVQARRMAAARKSQEAQAARDVQGRPSMAGIGKIPRPAPSNSLTGILPIEPRPETDSIVRIPLAVNTSERAAMLPPIPAERLRRVAFVMKSRGLNTLYYPVLFNGHAAIPTQAFPRQSRALASLEEAATIARQNGLRTVGYLNTLSWRSRDGGPHWLDAHPDWVDRDIQGRTRLEWLREHPEAVPSTAVESTVLSDYISPAVPEVARRLEALVSDAAKLPGIDGLAFADWSSLSGTEFQGYIMAPPTPPRLGYSLSERLLEMEARGIDPIDEAIYPQYFMPDEFGDTSHIREEILSGERRFHQRRLDLVTRLLERSRQANPGLSTVLVMDHSARSDRVDFPPAAGLVVSTGETAFPPGVKGILAPVVPAVPRSRPTASFLMSFTNDHLKRLLANKKEVSAVLWDFRAYPERVEEALLWIAPPGTPGADGSFAVW